MVVIVKSGTSEKEVQELQNTLEKLGVKVFPTFGEELTILGLVGDTMRIDAQKLEANPLVERVLYIKEPYKKANRMFKGEPSVIKVGDVQIGNGNLIVAAGPCSVESYDQITTIAEDVKKSGAKLLRGGAFKPRSSPYNFQGMGAEGLDLLIEARKQTGLPIVTELMSTEYLDRFVEDVDIIQIGARNMQNFDLLKELGKVNKPILLKRGLSATLEELLMSAEYIMAGGNENVILCERGIRTFETYTRNTLDLSAIPALKRLTHLPVFIDPSHAAGKAWMVESLSLAAVAAGADGLIIEVHNDPKNALSDGPQCITPDQFDIVMKKVGKIAEVVGKTLD